MKKIILLILLFSAPVLAGQNYTHVITSQPVMGNPDSILTAFDGDMQGLNIKHMVTGSNTMGSPGNFYGIVDETAAIYVNGFYNSGYNTGVSSKYGRSGFSLNRYKLFHHGKGDASTIYSSVSVLGNHTGDDSFHDNSAGIILNGQVNLFNNNTYANILELNAHDNGFDASAVGAVFNLFRDNDKAKLDQFWNGARIQSNGSKAIDSAYTMVGKFKTGIDLVHGQFKDNSAIALEAGQRIYLNAKRDSSVFSRFPSDTGGTWIESNEAGHLKFFVNGELKLELK